MYSALSPEAVRFERTSAFAEAGPPKQSVENAPFQTSPRPLLFPEKSATIGLDLYALISHFIFGTHKEEP